MKNRIRYDYWKDGKKRALTFSYDDGRDYDRRVVEILNRYGLHGTFHLNAGRLDTKGYLRTEELAELFEGHEVSCHTYTHPFLDRIPQGEIANEILEDRRTLERLTGYPMRGMSYPYGAYNDDVIDSLRRLGMHYSRTTKATQGFKIPEDFMCWHPTCHHKHDILDKIEPFKSARPLALFYVWGHSFEFPRDNNWDVFEEFCAATANDPETWYATNIEIYDYVTALRALDITADGDRIYNPSATDVWVSVNGKAVCCPGGRVTTLLLEE